MHVTTASEYATKLRCIHDLFTHIMKAEVTKIDVPVGIGIAIPAYRVDIEDYQVVGYHESTTRKATYNVYEQEAVANYVANAINKGEIIPYMMEIDHTYPED